MFVSVITALIALLITHVLMVLISIKETLHVHIFSLAYFNFTGLGEVEA